MIFRQTPKLRQKHAVAHYRTLGDATQCSRYRVCAFIIQIALS